MYSISVRSTMALRVSFGLLLVFAFFRSSKSQNLEEGCIDVRNITGPQVPTKVIIASQRGNLYSPGFQQNKVYPDYVRCSYQLQAPKGMHVRLKFSFLEIDATESCAADSLSLYDFDSSGRGQFQFKMCGSQAPQDYVSKAFALQLVLQTDGFAGRRGFNITYWPQDSGDVCSAGQKQCRNRNCVDKSKVCDGTDDCGDGTDEEKCSVALPSAECGRPEVDPVSLADLDRIVGGKQAVPGSWPWMADLQMDAIWPNGHICGGSLINAQWVLTAAHCVGGERNRFPSSWRIHLGNHHKWKRDPYEQIRYVERIVVYDDIPPSKFEQDGEYDLTHDVTLLKLNAPVQFNKFVKPVCLPEPGKELTPMADNCYATGWGTTRGTGSNDALKQAYHPVQYDTMCRRLVGNSFKPETMICAGSLAPLNGVCHGDSGGPFVCETKKGIWSIFGVASYVTDGTGELGQGLCGLKSRPSVFNKVSQKISWIKRMINKYD